MSENLQPVIKISNGLRDPSSYPTDQIKVGVTDVNGNTNYIELKGNFKGIGKRVLTIAPIIAHELGHALYAIQNPLAGYVWGNLLEHWYAIADNHIDPTDTQFPSFTGEGRLEGEPSGNRAAYLEYKIGKNMVVNDLWKQALEIIKAQSFDLKEDI